MRDEELFVSVVVAKARYWRELNTDTPTRSTRLHFECLCASPSKEKREVTLTLRFSRAFQTLTRKLKNSAVCLSLWNSLDRVVDTSIRCLSRRNGSHDSRRRTAVGSCRKQGLLSRRDVVGTSSGSANGATSDERRQICTNASLCNCALFALDVWSGLGKTLTPFGRITEQSVFRPIESKFLTSFP